MSERTWEQLAMWALIIGALILGLILGMWTTSAWGPAPDRRIPVVGHFPCMEDEVLIGVGEFNGGSWSAWTCEAADDLQAP